MLDRSIIHTYDINEKWAYVVMTCSLAEFPIFCKGNSEKGLKDLIFNRACAILKTINATFK